MATPQAIKRLFVGRPKSSGELEHTLLPKTIALPVFSSDPLSSVTYATQEILVVLSLAGVTALHLVSPIAIAVACLLAIVVTSYRQTVRAYPTGGGAYRVSRENLGKFPGLLAGSALLIDYTMTVAVSITAGVDAIASAAPTIEPLEVELAIGFIAFVTLANLRGVREAGVLFAIPTYGFVVSIYLIIGTGFVRCLGECPQAESAGMELHATEALTFLLVLKAFAAGTTALTGVEAIADGVPAFRYPQSKNAATTLGIMAFFSITMFLGISFLARNTGVVYAEDIEGQRMVVAQIANAVFSGGPLFYFVQVMSAAILILAANTAYQDFPRLASILAGDGFMPRQFLNRGDRLVFSNGVLILAVNASVLIYIFDANLTALIQLYLVGVFVSFTFSQAGMVMRRLRLKEKAWRRKAAVNGFGAMVTGTVLCVVIATKFKGGAWMVVTAIPILVFMMHSINRHYTDLSDQLTLERRRPVDRRPGDQRMLIVVNRVDAATARAVGYARSVRPAELRAITFDAANHGAWRRLAPEIEMETLGGGGAKAHRLLAHLREERAQAGPDDFLTVIVPEILTTRSLLDVLKRPGLQRLKAILVKEPGIQVLNVPVLKSDIDPGVDQAHEPARNFVCVLVSRVHNATLQAIEYAETLRPTDLRAVSFGLDPEATGRLGDEWLAAEVPIPLEIEDSPYRDIGLSLGRYVTQFRANGIDRVVTIVIPEFVVSKPHHRLLHGQTALIVKRHMLFERGVVVVSVPYELREK